MGVADGLVSTEDRFREARDAIELLVAVLSTGDPHLDREGFYSRLADGVARVAGMRRVVIFLFDEATRRVEAAGAYGIELERFADIRIGVELAPDAARALSEDRVIEVSPPARHAIPAEFAHLIGDHPLVYVPIAAGGRWPGLIIAEPLAESPPLDEERRDFLWMLGKVLALASITRIATFFSERTRELQHRMDLARDLHERVVQRLFGVSMALSPRGPLDGTARQRCADELQIALSDLRSAIQRPLGRTPRRTGATLAAELERLAEQPLGFALDIDGAVPEIPSDLEPLAQSVLAEAFRNILKHAQPSRVIVRVRRAESLVVLEVENDGVQSQPPAGSPGVGLRIAALEALQAGGLLEFGRREPGTWQVRLAAPDGVT
jgi:signal transduction histidine kinase